MLDIIDLWVCYEGEKEQTWGLAPAESIDEKGCSLFKPFYRPRQIFHDVFEHNFEERHPYFTGNHAFQKEGEIAAMGAWYYYGTRLELSRALAFTRNIHDCETVINETLTSWNRNIPLGSCVQPQKEIFDTDLEWLGKKIATKHCIEQNKIVDLLYWGYQRANGYIKTLEDELQAIKFLDFWEQFMQHNPPEKLWEEWKGIRFEISASPLTWSMQFIPLTQYAQFKIIKTSCD